MCTTFGRFLSFKGAISNPTKQQQSLLFRHLSISTTSQGKGAGFYIPESSCEDEDEIDAEFYEIG